MNREINIRLNANRAKAIHTGHKFASGDKGIVFRIAVDELDTMGTTAKIVFKRSNGTSVEAEITEETEGEGVYSYTTLGNEFAVVGPVTADVKFYDENENRVSTCTFLFDVTADTLDGLGVGTAGYSDTLERMKKSMEQAEADMLAAKAELEKQAEEILQQMEKTAENAEGDIEETEKKMADLSADLEALYQEYMAAFGNVGPFNPRGPYSETETYTVRDMVSHNDASWVCYRNCTGTTPGEESDCWQKLSVEAEVNPEDFLKKTDVDTELNEGSENPIANKAVAEAMKNVTITTDTELSKESVNAIANKAVAEALENVASIEKLCALPTQSAPLSAIGWYRIATFDTSSNAYGCIVSLGNAYGSGGGTSFILAFNGSHGKNAITQLSGTVTGAAMVDKVRCVSDGDHITHIEIHYVKDITNVVRVHVGNIWVRNSAVSVPFTAGEIPEGYTVTEFELTSIPIKAGGAAFFNDNGIPLSLYGATNHALIKFYKQNKDMLGFLGFDGADNPVVYGSDGTLSGTILHTGNKPKGSYTGNGDATERIIVTGGIGEVLHITSPSDGCAIFANANGIYYINKNGQSGNIPYSEGYYASGRLVLKTTNSVVNRNGIAYKYGDL